MKIEGINPHISTRYDRQTMLPQFGEDGQRKLSSARVLLVGVGGLGSPVALYLAGAGVGRIGLIDPDIVSESNLQRQILYKENETGLPKVECAKKRLIELNSTIRVDSYACRFEKDNAKEIASQYDLIIDGCDNFATRYLIDDISVELNIPYIYGSIGEFHGQLSVFNYNGGCRYRDLYPEEDAEQCDSQGINGVLAPVPGIIGTLQAIETIKVITGIGKTLRNRLLMVNMLTMDMVVLDI